MIKIETTREAGQDQEHQTESRGRRAASGAR